MKRILILVADEFEEIELVAPTDIWRRAGFQITLASISNQLQVTGQQNLKITTDIVLDSIAPDDFDGIFLPGGAGHKKIAQNEQCQQLIQTFIQQQKYIITICAATSVIASYLQNHKATGYPTTKNLIPNWVDQDVVIDLPFITSQGAGTALSLAYKVVEILDSESRSSTLKQAMIYTSKK